MDNLVSNSDLSQALRAMEDRIVRKVTFAMLGCAVFIIGAPALLIRL